MISSSDNNFPSNYRLETPKGDNKQRIICNKCNYIHYINPKIVVGGVISYKKSILLCKRAIEPQKGYWTIPAGYLEENESTEEGALREIYEESGVKPQIQGLLAIYSLKHISQIQLIYKFLSINKDLNPGVETEEADYFDWENIPWNELAFPSVRWALNHFKEAEGKEFFIPKSNPD
ncbi:MAG: NUDIX hydrolase [Rhodospirillaceae bacterium]|nr:NUDIX hydrolase [Rhodospirillaceae bacterium]